MQYSLTRRAIFFTDIISYASVLLIFLLYSGCFLFIYSIIQIKKRVATCTVLIFQVTVRHLVDQRSLCSTVSDLCSKIPLSLNVISQSTTCSWINIPINQSELSDTFTGTVCFRLTTTVWCSCPLVIQRSSPSDLWDKIWEGFGLWVGLCFWAVMLFQDQQKMSDLTKSPLSLTR